MNMRVSGASIAARQAVLVAIQTAELRFLHREDEHRAAGRFDEAEGAHRYAMWCHRALEAERRDPKPKDLA